MQHRPCRSMLYIPASKPRALEKARHLRCDAIIFDLEDAVAPDEKDSAREGLRSALAAGDYRPRVRLVRVNALDGPWGAADLEAVHGMDCDGVLVPKASDPEQIDAVAARIGVPIWAMIETPAGVLAAAQICAHPSVDGIVLGTNDLVKDLGLRSRPDRLPLMYALQSSLMAARAAGVVAIDGVYNAFRDTEGFEFECRQGRDLGFDGKSLIHPDQIAAANEAFAPSMAEVALAKRQIAAHAAAEAAGQGVAVVDGSIVEALHVEAARALLARAKAITEIELS